MSEMKNCLYCGHNETEVTDITHKDRLTRKDRHGICVLCNHCGSTGPTQPNAQQAIVGWNLRRDVAEGESKGEG